MAPLTAHRFRRWAVSRLEWESLCRRCGECCFEKWITEDGRIVPTRVACRYLDSNERTCKVYANRFEVGEGCVQLTPENLAELSWLPAGCGYLQLLPPLVIPEEQTNRQRQRSKRRTRKG
jgi:uncharacterized protein